MIIAVLGWVLASGLSGIVGNRADATVSAVFRTLVQRIKEGGKPVNHELGKVVLRSFILALRDICKECLKELKPKEQPEVARWLKGKKASIEKQLKEVEKMKYVEPQNEELSEIELLLTPEGKIAEGRVEAIKAKLIKTAIKNGELSSCYKIKVHEGLFERMCGYFTFELKHNEVVRKIFEEKLLARIAVKLQGQQVTVEHIEDSLREVAKAVPQVLEMLNKIGVLIYGGFEKIDARMGQVTTLLKISTKGIEDLKKQVTTMHLGTKLEVPTKSETKQWTEIPSQSFSIGLPKSLTGQEDLRRFIFWGTQTSLFLSTIKAFKSYGTIETVILFRGKWENDNWTITLVTHKSLLVRYWKDYFKRWVDISLLNPNEDATVAYGAEVEQAKAIWDLTDIALPVNSPLYPIKIILNNEAKSLEFRKNLLQDFKQIWLPKTTDDFLVILSHVFNGKLLFFDNVDFNSLVNHPLGKLVYFLAKGNKEINFEQIRINPNNTDEFDFMSEEYDVAINQNRRFIR